VSTKVSFRIHVIIVEGMAMVKVNVGIYIHVSNVAKIIIL
jgi:hypothetical protein